MPNRNRQQNQTNGNASGSGVETPSPSTEVNITVPHGNAATGQQDHSTTLSWSSILAKGLSFGGPAVIILLLGMMIMSPRGQEFLFGIKPVDTQAVVAMAVEDKLAVLETNRKRDLEVLRVEIDKERQITIQERARDREVWTLQLQGINKAIDDIRAILQEIQQQYRRR